MYPRLLELGPITLYSYGVLLAAAYLLGLKLAMARARSAGLDSTKIMDLGIYIIISALVGAKAMLLIVDFDFFSSNPRQLLNLLRSGGVFYGGLILAVVVACWDMSIHRPSLENIRHGCTRNRARTCYRQVRLSSRWLLLWTTN